MEFPRSTRNLFAFHILYHFMGEDLEFTRNWALHFRERYIVNLPREGGVMKSEDILAFIEEKRGMESGDVIPIRLYKYRNPKTKELSALATTTWDF